MRMRKGRPLSEQDVKGSPTVTVINETMAKKYFAGEEPIGQRIMIQELIPGKTQLRAGNRMGNRRRGRRSPMRWSTMWTTNGIIRAST